jgi:UDP-N-acetylmuramoyl-tripeptide--D-alanyl-D-alanine ligase
MLDTNEQKKAPLWTWRELSEGLLHRCEEGPDVLGVKVDSRLICPGDLFIALPGDPGPRFNPSYRSDIDGHDYIAAAAANGAVGAIIHHPQGSLVAPAEFPVLEVADTYDGLWDLGRLARKRLLADVVAVTGSSGKTTAKHFLTAALQAYSPPGSFNNHIGVPLALANAPADCATGVFEIGTNHPGEIEPLAHMVCPDLAIVLNVHRAHIENFADQAALRAEKLSIFKALKDKSKAISEDVLKLGFGLTFGESKDADARVLSISGDKAEINLLSKNYTARVPGGGIHRAKSVAAALLACHLLDHDLDLACNLPAETIPTGRGNVRQAGQVTVIDDSYNANPDSMKAGITTLLDASATRRIAVIGEMLELGEASEEGHLELLPKLLDADVVFCVGKGTKTLAQQLGASWQLHADQRLAAQIAAAATPGTAILVKGSNRVFWACGFVDELMRYLNETSD